MENETLERCWLYKYNCPGRTGACWGLPDEGCPVYRWFEDLIRKRGEKVVTAKDLAQKLNGCEYGSEMTAEDRKAARENGLVVVYGCSDDLAESVGAIRDEGGCYDGESFQLTKNGALTGPNCGDKDCEYYRKATKDAKWIKAVWHNGGNPCWTYETEIPHETFDVYEDGELFCIGIVFRMVDL